MHAGPGRLGWPRRVQAVQVFFLFFLVNHYSYSAYLDYDEGRRWQCHCSSSPGPVPAPSPCLVTFMVGNPPPSRTTLGLSISLPSSALFCPLPNGMLSSVLHSVLSNCR